MRVKEFTMTAVIPTAQYSNVQPSITIDVEDDDIEVVKTEARKHIEQISAMYAEGGKALTAKQTATEATGELVETLSGEQMIYDDVNHTYHSLEGVQLLSASTYAQRFGKPFLKDMMAGKCANAWGVDEKDILNIWKLNGDISTNYGTAVHLAIELWEKHHRAGELISASKKDSDGTNYVLPDHPYLRQLVEDFAKQYPSVDPVMTEVWLSDIERGMAGQCDRLVDLGNKQCIVQDLKTGKTPDKNKLKVYRHQLSFYAAMVEKAGWDVKGLEVLHHDGDKWTKYPLEKSEVKL